MVCAAIKKIVFRFCLKCILSQKNSVTLRNPMASVEAAPARNFIIKKTLAQIFSCKFCELSKNTFFYRASPVASSVSRKVILSFIFYFLLNAELATGGLATLLKKRLYNFPVSFAKILKTLFYRTPPGDCFFKC